MRSGSHGVSFLEWLERLARIDFSEGAVGGFEAQAPYQSPSRPARRGMSPGAGAAPCPGPSTRGARPCSGWRRRRKGPENEKRVQEATWTR